MKSTNKYIDRVILDKKNAYDFTMDLESDFDQTGGAPTLPPFSTQKNALCIASCGKPGLGLNPYTLGVDIRDVSLCPIVPHKLESFDANYEGLGHMGVIDFYQCDPEVPVDIPISFEEYLLTGIHLIEKNFLELIYQIKNFDEAIEWSVNNSTLPLNTIKRIHNTSWKMFGSDINNLSDSVCQYYLNLVHKKWIKIFINILSTKYSFSVQSDSDHPLNDILIKMITREYILDVFRQYIDIYLPNWLKIDDHYDNLKKFTLQCIRESLDKKHQ